MSDRIDDVKATSDAVLEHAERLHALEVEKRTLDPASDRFHELSIQIEDLGTRLATMTSVEREVAEAQDSEAH